LTPRRGSDIFDVRHVQFANRDDANDDGHPFGRALIVSVAAEAAIDAARPRGSGGFVLVGV
jgi:hypothetical protein